MQALAAHGMNESKDFGVQSLAAKGREGNLRGLGKPGGA